MSATRRVPLGAIAYARSGDKGGHANIGLWVPTTDAYRFVRGAVTVELVRAHFATLLPVAVDRYELPNLRALNFVLRGVLGVGGGASGLRTDAQAKAFGQALLRAELDIPVELLDRHDRPPFLRGA